MLSLFSHQQSLLDLNPTRHALLWEPGTGKTIGALGLVFKNCKSFLVICPKGLKTGWERAIASYISETGNDKPIDYLVITKETFRRDYDTLPAYDGVINDEIHYFLGTKSAMMKSLRSYLKKHDTIYRYFLTGTPYRSTPMDIYVLSSLLGQKQNYWSFFNRFFVNVQMGSRMVPLVRPNIEDEVAKITRALGNTVKLSDCIDMPPQTFSEEFFPLTSHQKKAIDELEDILPVQRYTKIHQICGGTLKGDEYVPHTVIPSNKQKRLVEFCGEVDRVIVVCRYNLEIGNLAEKLSAAYPQKLIRVINGAIEDKQAVLDELSASPDSRYVLLVNAKISEGWQLQNCSHMVFYSYDFELKNKIQMEARITRIDAPRPTYYLALTTKDTIDESVSRSLKNKETFHVKIYNETNL